MNTEHNTLFINWLYSNTLKNKLSSDWLFLPNRKYKILVPKKRTDRSFLFVQADNGGMLVVVQKKIESHPQPHLSDGTAYFYTPS